MSYRLAKRNYQNKRVEYNSKIRQAIRLPEKKGWGNLTAPIYIKKHPKNEFTHSLSALLPNGQDEIVNTEGGPYVSARFCASR